MPRPKLPHGSWLLALALGALGCGKIREIGACRAIAGDINAAFDDIETLSKKNPVDELLIAKRYADLAAKLAPRASGESPLALAARDFVGIAQSTDATLRAHADLTRSQYVRGEQKRELERLVKRERAAASRIDAVCHD